MSHFLILAGCGIALAGVLLYACWVKLRVLNLQADLYTLLASLEKEATHLHRQDDLAYMHTRRLLLALWDFAPRLSPLTVFYLVSVCRDVRFEPAPRSDCAELQAAIDRTIERASGLLTRYIIRQTVTGIVIRAYMQMLPKAVLKKEAKQAIHVSVESVGNLSEHASFAV